jgi:uncharacterized membrane protein YcaP (DUF421 family)
VLAVDWSRVLEPDVSLLEIFVRGTLMYLALFALLRIVFKRQSARGSVTDLLVIVLIADAAQNGMAGNYQTVPDGIVLVAVIIGWAWLIDFLTFHFPRLERIVKPPPLPLVVNGEVLWQNLRRELVSYSDLAAQLRLQGVADISEVEVAQMESDGRISAITKDHQRHDPIPEPRQA